MKTTEKFERVNLNEIVISSFNVRGTFHENSIQELANSMRENGLINPLTLRRVSNNQYEIICGERRFRAAKLLGWERIDAYIKDVTNDEAQELCLIENIQREDISPIEEAKAFEKLQTTGDLNELVSRTGKSANYIRVRLQLNSLIPEIANLLNQEDITFGVATVICSYSKEIQREVFEKFYHVESYNNWFSYNKEEVRRRIESIYTTQLDQYCFDLSDCKSCPHNTANFSLFGDGGKCVNKSCLNEKNTKYLTDEAIRLKKENPLVVLCAPTYGQTNDSVIGNLKLQEYEIQEDNHCRLYPSKPEEPEYADISDEEEIQKAKSRYEEDVQTYNQFIEELKQKEEKGELTRYAVIRDKNIQFKYREHETKNPHEELKKQLSNLKTKDKRNQELKVINTVKDTKEFMEQNEIMVSKEFSTHEECLLYFFLLSSLNPKHYPIFGLPNNTYFLEDEQKKNIVESGLTDEQKNVIRRDFILKKFDSAFGSGTTSNLYVQFMKEHFHDEVVKIEKKYEEVYNKRYIKIKEQISTLNKQLKKKEKAA